MELATYNSPLGPLYFFFHQEQLVYASFHREEGQRWSKRHFPQNSEEPAPLNQAYLDSLNSYFQGQPLNWPGKWVLTGTSFQKKVWAEIAKIPHGQVSTYKGIAQSVNTRAYQAVGQAVGANPISIIIPCHRVLGTDWFGGYGGGLNRKRLLLELENVTLAPNLNA